MFLLSSSTSSITPEQAEQTISLFKQIMDNVLSPKVIIPIITLVAGIVAIKIIMKLFAKALAKSRIDISLHTFLKSLLRISLYVVLLMTAASMIGIPITSLVTVLGALGLAVSLAVKDSLSNLAGGFLVLFTKPFSVGDFVETEGVSGTVKAVNLFYTRLNTIDNKRIFIPNGQLSNAKIINYSAEPTRMLDRVFSIGYEDNMDQAKQIITDIILRSDYALLDPEPLVRVKDHSESSIDILVRVWVQSEHYFDLDYYLHEEIKRAFDKRGIHIPYQQLDVYLHEAKDTPDTQRKEK
ncbi:MAG TPA: mechanosensitive ion channel [Firmicutes bacterium]|nr:mechanosensitive ion channel [Bacillota bacterium]